MRYDTGFGPSGSTYADDWAVANSLGAATGSDKFYTVIGNSASDVNNERNLYTCLGSGTWSATSPCSFAHYNNQIENPDAGHFTGVAATGRAVGWYRTNYFGSVPAYAEKRNYVCEYNPTGTGYAINGWSWVFKAMDSTTYQGEAWSVSADGNKIFGRSPTPTDTNWHGYKAVATSAKNSVSSIHQLPDLPGTTGSTRLACPYGCTADGRYAVGMNYPGAETGVLWDTGDANPANWTVLDLYARAASEGILGNFTALYRPYSVGTNSSGYPVITGVGHGTTRQGQPMSTIF